MTHLRCREWDTVAVSAQGGANTFSMRQAETLMAAARAHHLGGKEGRAILTHYHAHLKAGQMVGVLAAPGCSLEILPKVDPSNPALGEPTLHGKLVTLIDLALDLGIDAGESETMRTGEDTLLEVFIRLFATRLTTEVRRGLPRLYVAREEDLRALRGRLDVARQLTVNAVRPDRLSCRFDELDSDIPLMQVMACAIISLRKRVRHRETARLLDELRFAFDGITLLPASRLPWHRISIDRSNRSWECLLRLARMLLGQTFQSTAHSVHSEAGHSLLFPMNDLFEKAVVTLLRRALADSGYRVDAQDSSRYCLTEGAKSYFQARPDIVIRRNDQSRAAVAIIDTKWKRLDANHLDEGDIDDDGDVIERSGKGGVSQADVYQLMAYARLHACPLLMLLYPALPEGQSQVLRRFTINPQVSDHRQTLLIATLDMAQGLGAIMTDLKALVKRCLPQPISRHDGPTDLVPAMEGYDYSSDACGERSSHPETHLHVQSPLGFRK
jgi:5-methylcytosine-specific restriction enzyme subunit McrC